MIRYLKVFTLISMIIVVIIGLSCDLGGSNNSLWDPSLTINTAAPGNAKLYVNVGSKNTNVDITLEVHETKNFTGTPAASITLKGNGKTQNIFTPEDTLLANGTDYYFRLKGIVIYEGKTYDSGWYDDNEPLIPHPYYITSLGELQLLGNDPAYPADETYTLQTHLNFLDANNDGIYQDPFDSDRDSTNGNWTPLPNFQGSFDGKNHTLSGMRIEGLSDAGLFQRTDGGGVLKNLGLINVFIESPHIAGAFTATNKDLKIENCYFEGEIFGDSNVGGIAGNNNGEIVNSHGTGNITGVTASVGGLVGYNAGEIKNTYFSGNVKTGGDNLGGIAGYNSQGIKDSYATGLVENTGTGSYTGGLAGVNYGGTIRSSYTINKVIGSGYVGGLVGQNTGIAGTAQIADLSYSFSSGGVTGISGQNVGGAVGYNDTANGSTVTSVYSYDEQMVTGGTRHPQTVSASQLRSVLWYKNILDWKTWHIDGPVEGGFYPHVNKEGDLLQMSSSEVPQQKSIPLP